jgi:hypothetical protein
LITAYFLIDAAGWTWIIVIAVLLVAGYFFIDRLMRKGIYEGRAGGRTGRMGSAQSELQTLVDPAHRHVIEEQDRKRAEHDDAGDDPDAN